MERSLLGVSAGPPGQEGAAGGGQGKLVAVLRWAIVYGDDLEEFAEWTKRDGRLPLPLRTQPELDPELAPILEAFWSLSGDRGFTNGIPLAIPFVSIVSYARVYGFDEDVDQFRRFEVLIRVLDATFIKDRREQIDEERRVQEENRKRGV